MGSTFRWDQRGLAAVDAVIAADITRRTIRVESAAKRIVRVDTGRLRASITHETGVDERGIFGRAGTNVNYALPVEARYPYLRPALGAAR